MHREDHSDQSGPALTKPARLAVDVVLVLDGQALLGAHLVRASERRWKAEEIGPLARRFVVEVDRLIQAIDALPTT